MANYATLKAAVADVVKTNGAQAITGANLQTVLLSIINSIGGGGYIFKGVATPSTSVGTPDENVFYIGGAGTYANFSNAVVGDGQIGLFTYNGSWSASVVNVNAAQRAISLAWFETLADVPNANGYINTSGTVSGLNTARYTNYISVKPNTEYIIRSPFVLEQAAVALYNDEYIFTRSLQGELTGGNLIFTTQANERYVRFSLWQYGSFPSYISPNKVSLFEGMQIDIDTTNIKDKAVTSNKLSEDVRDLFGVYQITSDNVEAGYVHRQGFISQLAGYSATDYLPVKMGVSVNIPYPFIQQDAAVALYDKGKNFTRSLTSAELGENPKVAEIAPTEGECYLRVSFRAARIPATIILSTDKSTNSGEIYTEQPLITGGYIGTTGSVIPLASFSYSDYVELPTGIKFKVVNETAESASFAIYNSDKSVSRVILSGDVSGQEYIEFTLTGNETYIRASFQSQNVCSVMFAEILTKLDILKKFSSDNRKEDVTNVLAAFDNIVCVGDSLTYSQVYTSVSGSRQAKRTYPVVLGKLCGNETTAFATPGASARSCWESYGEQITAKTNALAIIYLGTNEGITDTLDTDVVGDNPANWANNNTGCYCRFVQKFQSLGYKVLLLKCWVSSGSLQNTNSAIVHIGQRFGCAVLDAPTSKALKYHYYPDLSGSNYVHYNDLGYSWFASSLIVAASNMDDDEMKYIIPTA